MKFYQLQRSPEGDAGGGAGLSLQDIEGTTDGSGVVLSEEEVAAKAAQQQGIGGTPSAADLQAEADRLAAEQAAGGAAGGRPADAGDAAAKTDAEKVAEAEAEAQRLTDEAAAAGGDGDDEGDFYAAVDALRGDELSTKITYPDGVEPTSPEGVLIREKFIEKQGAEAFDAHLKKTDPRGYAYLLHRQAGGDDTSFFETPSFVLPDLDAVKDSVDLQRQVVKQGHIMSGLSEARANKLIEMAIADGELAQEAEEVYGKIKAKEEAAFAAINKKVEEDRKADQTRLTQFDTLLTTEITKGENLKFIIPEADKPKFIEAVKENLAYENGEFFLVKPVSKENLSEVLQTELFGYLKGDMKKLIERQSKNIVAQRLRLNANKQDKPNNAAQNPGGSFLGDL